MMVIAIAWQSAALVAQSDKSKALFQTSVASLTAAQKVYDEFLVCGGLKSYVIERLH